MNNSRSVFFFYEQIKICFFFYEQFKICFFFYEQIKICFFFYDIIVFIIFLDYFFRNFAYIKKGTNFYFFCLDFI